MDVHYHILYATMLTAMFITNQSEFALLFPVWAVVAVGSALPAVVVWATVMGIKAFVAAVFRRHTRRLYLAIEGLAAMLAGKLLRMVFHRGKKTSVTAIVSGRTRGANIESKLRATPLTDKLDEWILSHGYAMAFAKALARTVFASSFGPIEEDFVANRADMFDAGNTGDHSHTSGSINRDYAGGAFPGKNACRWAASPPKPHVEYTAIRQRCQGGVYAKC